MTKLAIISPQRMCKILERLGFYRDRQKGSHSFYKHSDGRATVVPMHKGEDLSRGMLRAILRDIEITVEAYEKLRTGK